MAPAPDSFPPNTCFAPYVFYSCIGGFKGCCQVDACDSGCPPSEVQPASFSASPSAAAGASSPEPAAQTSGDGVFVITPTAMATATVTSQTVAPNAATSSSTTRIDGGAKAAGSSTASGFPSVSSSPESTSSSGSSISTSTLIGLTVGLLVVCICAIILACLLWRRRRRRRSRTNLNRSDDENSPQTDDEKLDYTPIPGKDGNGEDCFAEFGGRFDRDATEKRGFLNKGGLRAKAQKSPASSLPSPSQPELDGSPRFELDSVSGTASRHLSELETAPATQTAFQRAIESPRAERTRRASACSSGTDLHSRSVHLSDASHHFPRATLEATPYERNSQIHVASWADFKAIS